MRTQLTVSSLVCVAILALTAAPARAGHCDNVAPDKVAKCEKRIQKMRKRTEAFQPSTLSKKLRRLDQQNPLDSDDWYVGLPKPTGVGPLDRLVGSVTRIEATLTLGRFTADLHTQGKTQRAARLAGVLMPLLTKLPAEITTITKSVDKIANNPGQLVEGNLLKVPRVASVSLGLVKKMPKLASDVPEVTGLLAPLVNASLTGAGSGARAVAEDDSASE